MTPRPKPCCRLPVACSPLPDAQRRVLYPARERYSGGAAVSACANRTRCSSPIAVLVSVVASTSASVGTGQRGVKQSV